MQLDRSPRCANRRGGSSLDKGLVCASPPPGTLGSCHQWDAGDSSYDSGTIFVLNHRANASGSFPGSEFMIEAPSVGALNLRARAVPRASTWERGGRGGGSCKTVGCGTPYSSSLPCQCFRGCEPGGPAFRPRPRGLQMAPTQVCQSNVAQRACPGPSGKAISRARWCLNLSLLARTCAPRLPKVPRLL